MQIEINTSTCTVYIQKIIILQYDYDEIWVRQYKPDEYQEYSPCIGTLLLRTNLIVVIAVDLSENFRLL